MIHKIKLQKKMIVFYNNCKYMAERQNAFKFLTQRIFYYLLQYYYIFGQRIYFINSFFEMYAKSTCMCTGCNVITKRIMIQITNILQKKSYWKSHILNQICMEFIQLLWNTAKRTNKLMALQKLIEFLRWMEKIYSMICTQMLSNYISEYK